MPGGEGEEIPKGSVRTTEADEVLEAADRQ